MLEHNYDLANELGIETWKLGKLEGCQHHVTWVERGDNKVATVDTFDEALTLAKVKGLRVGIADIQSRRVHKHSTSLVAQTYLLKEGVSGGEVVWDIDIDFGDDPRYQ